MGLFSLACPICWERGCDCTPEELVTYSKKAEERIKDRKPDHPLKGKLFVIDEKEYVVEAVVEGTAQLKIVTNNAVLMERILRTEEELYKGDFLEPITKTKK